MVSHFVKQALLNIARDCGRAVDAPNDRAGWARLAQRSASRSIHIAERDTQVSAEPPKAAGEFVNTWSIDGFVGEGCQPAELGWGSTRSTSRPTAAPRLRLRRGDLPDAAGRRDAVRTWTPLGRADPRLPHHPQRIDLDLRLPDAGERATGRLPADGALRLSPVRRHGAVGARAGRPQLAACRSASA
jgi:hypothetical protein